MLKEIQELVEKEITERYGNIIKELTTTKSRLTKVTNEFQEYKKVNAKAEEIVKQQGLMDDFRAIINGENFPQLVKLLKLNESKMQLTERDIESERIPVWFAMVVKYYDDRAKIFPLLEMFNIKFPNWAPSIRFPQDYTKDEILHVIKYFEQISIPNGKHFDNDNIRYFWDAASSAQGNPKKIIGERKGFDTDIPMQLLAQNPYFEDDDVFEAILQRLKKSKDSYSMNNLFKIIAMQNLTEDKTAALLEVLPEPSKMNETHKRFIARYSYLIKNHPHLALLFSKKIEEHGAFSYLNFPVAMQLDFVKSASGLPKKCDLISAMDLPREDKLKLIMEFASKAI